MKHWTDYFVTLSACQCAIDEAKTYSTWNKWWTATKRADWMLWGLARIKNDPSSFRLACCDCAEYSLANYEKAYPDDKRPRQAIETARRFALGEATIEELDAAAWSAESAARSAAWSAESAAWSAARSAAWSAAWSAEGSTRSAAWSAARSTRSAESAAYSDMADLIRKRIPKPPKLQA